MSPTPAEFDFRALLDATQTDEKNAGVAIVITLGHSLTRGTMPAARIRQEHMTPSGRRGEPKKLITITADPGKTPGDLLRLLARLYDEGPVGVTAPPAPAAPVSGP